MDCADGRSEPPRTYYTAEYRDEWQRGYDDVQREINLRQEVEEAEEARWRGLPASWRAMDELERAVGCGHAEKIKALVEAMIEEAQAA